MIDRCSRLAFLLLFLVPGFVFAGELPWPDKDGPNFDGTVPAKHARGLPVQWDAASGKNIAWSVPIPEHGHSTPVIGEGRIWLTSATEDGKQQFIHAIDEKSGKVLHHKLLFENADPEPLNNPINTYASPSCVLEPGVVYVHFGTYGTAKLDAETAEVIWQRRDINARHFRGPGSSPVLFENLLILTFDGVDQQYLTAINKDTGKTVWRTDRTTDYGDLDENGVPKREGDLRKAYSTPGLVTVNGETQVVSCGSRAAFGYDARTGRELWTITHDDFNAAARPAFIDDLAIINTGSRGANLLAVRLNETTRGDVTDSHIVWNRTKGNSRLSTPALAEGRLYFVSDNGVVTSVDARTGEEIWKGRIGGNHVASPIVANGQVYFCDEDGVTSVLSAGDEFEIVARNKTADGTRASFAAAEGAIFLRTFTMLYKIEKDVP